MANEESAAWVITVSEEGGGLRWDLRASARVLGGVENKTGNWTGERLEDGSGGSGGKGGGRRASPEVEDGGFAAEAWPARPHRFCIGSCVRERLTFFIYKYLILLS